MDVTNHQPSEREGAWARANREELVERLGQAVRRDGRIYPLNGLMLRRESAPTEMGHGMSYLSFCVIAQGSKEVMLGDKSLSSSLCKWLPTCAYIGNRPIKRIAS